jgi:hypothetical protein
MTEEDVSQGRASRVPAGVLVVGTKGPVVRIPLESAVRDRSSEPCHQSLGLEKDTVGAEKPGEEESLVGCGSAVFIVEIPGESAEHEGDTANSGHEKKQGAQVFRPISRAVMGDDIHAVSDPEDHADGSQK